MKSLKEKRKQKAIEEHRKMWTWLAENPSLDKEDYFNTFEIEAKLSECFLCDYAYKERKGKHSHCTICPLDWGSDETIPTTQCCDKHRNGDDKGYFSQWHESETKAKRTKFAKIIAELPEKE